MHSEFVQALFGRTVSEARRNLQEHVSKWSAKGRCPELTGGGLIRSAGGRHAVKEAYRDGIRISGDERILGGSDFVETTLKHSGEVYGRRLRSAILPLGSCRSREAKSLFDSISTAPRSAGQRTGSAMMRTSPQPSRPSLRCSCRLQVNNEQCPPS